MRSQNTFFLNATLVCLLLFGSHYLAAQDPKNTRQELIQLLMSSQEVASLRADGHKLVIVTTSYCAKNDCPSLFANYSDQVVFYSKEDCFMRKITKWIEITHLSAAEKYIAIQYRNGYVSKQLTYHSKY